MAHTLATLLLSYYVVIVNMTTVPSEIIYNNTSRNGTYSVQPNSTARKHVCNARHQTFYKITSGVLLPFIPITILGNAVVCIVASFSPIFYKHPSYIFLASLAVADVLVGTLSMPIKTKVQWNNGYFCLPQFVCWIYMLEEVTFSVASVTHIFAIAADRYVALRYPYRYKTFLSRRRIAIVIFILWTFSISCSLLSMFKWTTPNTISIDNQGHISSNANREFFTSLYIICFIIPSAFMSYIYHFIYKTSAHHINEITKLDILNSPSSRERCRRNRHFRMIRSITIVFAVYTICWIPTIIFIFLTFYMKADFWGVYVQTEWFEIVYFLLIQLLPHLNSALNPFIYVLSNTEFRDVVYRLLLRISGKNNRYQKPITESPKKVPRALLTITSIHLNAYETDALQRLCNDSFPLIESPVVDDSEGDGKHLDTDIRYLEVRTPKGCMDQVDHEIVQRNVDVDMTEIHQGQGKHASVNIASEYLLVTTQI